MATISRPSRPSPSTARRLASNTRISFGPRTDREWAIWRIQRWRWYRSQALVATARSPSRQPTVSAAAGSEASPVVASRMVAACSP